MEFIWTGLREHALAMLLMVLLAVAGYVWSFRSDSTKGGFLRLFVVLFLVMALSVLLGGGSAQFKDGPKHVWPGLLNLGKKN